MRYDTVVFDLDGTLVDTAPDLAAATNHVLRQAGRASVSLADVREMCGHGARKLIVEGFERTGEALPQDRLEPLYDAFVAYYAAHIADFSQPFPGAANLLARCRAEGIAVAVCTNKLEALSVRLIETLGFDAYVGAIVGSDTTGEAKPGPAPYLEAVRRVDGRLDRSVMIGDSSTDIATARAVGVPVIAVSFGYTDAPIATYHPDHIVDHFDDIWPLIVRT